MCETIFEKLTQKWHFRSKLFGNSSVVTQPRSDPVRWRKVRLPDRTGSGTSGPGPESGPAVRLTTNIMHNVYLDIMTKLPIDIVTIKPNVDMSMVKIVNV